MPIVQISEFTKTVLKNIQNIQFREKLNFHISVEDKELIANSVNDRYSIAFLNSSFLK